MILEGGNKSKYLAIRPDDALDLELEVLDDTIKIDFPIQPNKEYVVVVKNIKSTDGEMLPDPLVYSFTSEYSPLVANISIIQNDLGELFEVIGPDRILRALRENSANITHITDKSPTSHEVVQYIRYKTELDVLMGSYTKLSSKDVDKFELGDFSVSKSSSSSSSIDPLIEGVRQNMEFWLAKLGGAMARGKSRSFTKGGDDYPDYMSREISS